MSGPFGQLRGGSAEEKRACRQNAMEAAKAEQMATLASARRRLMAFERQQLSGKQLVSTISPTA